MSNPARARASAFSSSLAWEFAANPGLKAEACAANSQVILIDGRQLAELMIDHDVGVSVESRYDIKRVDLDCFEDGQEGGSGSGF